MHWKTQNIACSYAHGDTFLFHLATSPLSNTKTICQSIILSLSLLSHHHHRKEKEKVLVAFFENISVADIFLK